jgi:hypothetical protein
MLEALPGTTWVLIIITWVLIIINVTCCLYDEGRNVFDAGTIHYEGQWKGGWALKSRLFWALKWQRAKRLPFGPKKIALRTRPPPPHPYRLLYGTIKKSTAPYKVHNMQLQYRYMKLVII